MSSKSSKSSGSRAAGRRRAPRRQAREFSAGGVVVRSSPSASGAGPVSAGSPAQPGSVEEVVTIVPTRRAADGSRVLALPKGHVDPGESPVEAATREVREETGIVGEPVEELGESRYWYRREGRTIGKSVAFFLFEFVEGDTDDHDDEVEEVRWIALEEARTALSHAAEREIVELALAHLHKDR
jgi:8-oxo-dGTP pyrophosphatase MutT (NUDIX family)